jgi:hypothetical protein
MTDFNDYKSLSGPQFVRLAETDRECLSFQLNGKSVQALKGDTVLTAILMNQSCLRKTEMQGMPRAGFCLMGACQDCWVTLASGQRLRACTSFIAPDMHITTFPGDPL